LHRILEAATSGLIAPGDFVPSPLAHPHCYSISYLLMLDGEDPPSLAGGFLPFTRFMSRATVFDLLSDSLYMQPSEKVERYRAEAIDEVWSRQDELPYADRLLSTLKRLIKEMFPSSGPIPLAQRQKIAERATKAIYIHSHMDE